MTAEFKDLTGITPSPVDIVPISLDGQSPAYFAYVATLVKNGLIQPNSAIAGFGDNIRIKAADGVTAGNGGNVTITAGSGSGVGAGGNIILQPGAQGTSGGDGIVQCTKKFQFYTGYSKSDLAFQINNTTTGMWYHSGANMFVWTINNTDTICFRQGYIRLSKGGGIYWSNTTNDAITASDDTAIYSASRGVFAVDASMQSVNPQGGSLAFKSFTTAQTANVNDWVMGPSAFQRVNCTTASAITGIAPYTGGAHVDGRMIRVYNVGNANLTLSHNSTSSTAANRFYNATGADIILAPNDYAELIWDGTNNGSGSSGWRVS